MSCNCRMLAIVLPLTGVLLGWGQPDSMGKPQCRPRRRNRSSFSAGDWHGTAALLQLLNDHSRTEKDAAALDRLVRQLGDEEFEIRDKASRAIIVLGPPALERLAEATKDRTLKSAAAGKVYRRNREEAEQGCGLLCRQRAHPPANSRCGQGPVRLSPLCGLGHGGSDLLRPGERRRPRRQDRPGRAGLR